MHFAYDDTCYLLMKHTEFPLAPMGVLALSSVHARPQLGPPSTLANILKRKCLQSHPQTSLPTPHKSYPKFQNCTTSFSRKNLKLANFPVKIEACYLYYLGAHSKIWNLVISLSEIYLKIDLPKIYYLCYLGVNLKFLNLMISLPRIYLNSASANGGPHSRVCARETLCSAPHQHKQKFFGAGVCRVVISKVS